LARAVRIPLKMRREKKGDQCHGKEFVGKDIPETLYPLKINQDTVKDSKCSRPKGTTNCTQDEES